MFCVLIFISFANGYPASWVQKISDNPLFSEINKKYDDEPSDLDIYFKENLTEQFKPKNDKASDFSSKEEEFADLDKDFNRNESKIQNYTKIVIPFTTDFSDQNKTNILAQKNETRNPRQENFDIDEQKASQETSSSEEEEEGNMLTGLLGAFLGGLSKPDGSIDLEAILGLLGSLSTQSPDGTYDFSGLTNLLRSFFGGDAGGGGSDIGAFVGGLLGAVIKGVANPPGAKGAGILAGKVVTGVLPALSGPPPSMDENGNGNGTKPTKAPQLDSGAFLTGFLRTALGSGGNGMGQGGKNSKYTLFKLLFSAITGVFSAASSLSSGNSDWN